MAGLSERAWNEHAVRCRSGCRKESGLLDRSQGRTHSAPHFGVPKRCSGPGQGGRLSPHLLIHIQCLFHDFSIVCLDFFNSTYNCIYSYLFVLPPVMKHCSGKPAFKRAKRGCYVFRLFAKIDILYNSCCFHARERTLVSLPYRVLTSTILQRCDL